MISNFFKQVRSHLTCRSNDTTIIDAVRHEVYDELNAPEIWVHIVFAGKGRTFLARFDTDVYDVVDYLLDEECAYQRSRGQFILARNLTGIVYYREKPLRRAGIPLGYYNIRENSKLHMQLLFQKGGAPLLPTYPIVHECELEVLSKDFIPQGLESLPIEQVFAFLKGKFPQVLCEDYWVKLLEDVYILWQMMGKAEDLSDYYQAVVVYIKLREPVPLMKTKMVSCLCAKIVELFTGLQPQSFEFVVGEARGYLGKFEELKNAPIFPKLYKFAMYALSLSLFDKFGVTFDKLRYSRVEAEAIKRKHHMGVDFVYTLMDTLVFLCERGIQCMKTGSMDPIFHSGAKYEEWFDKAYDIKKKAMCLSNPEAHGFSTFEFLADLSELIEQGQAIFRHASRIGEFEKKMVRGLLAELELIKSNQTTKRAAQQERNMPFPVLLYGGSSVGKSTLTKMLFYHYGKLFDLPTSSEYKYVRNPVAKFWDGFTTSQWCVHFDDIGYLHPNVAAQGDPSVLEIIQAINYVAMVPDQAALEDKGRTPMRAELILATTNVQHLNAVHYFQTPLAVQRRMPWIVECKPKLEFAKDECMLDSTKIVQIDGEWPNYWDFTIHKVVAADPHKIEGARAKIVKHLEFSDVDDFLAWFGSEAHKHKIVQSVIDDCDSNMRAIVVCKTCYRNASKCSCLQAQSVERPDDMGYFRYYSLVTLLAIVRWLAVDILANLVNTQHFENWWFNKPVEVPTTQVGDPDSDQFVECEVFHDSILEDLSLPEETDSVLVDHDELEEYHTMKRQFRVLGQRVQAFIGVPSNLLLAAGVVATIAGTYLLFKGAKTAFAALAKEKSEFQQQNSTTDIGSPPKSSGDEKPNVWYKDDFELTTFDVPSGSLSWTTMPEEEIVGRISRNVVHCSFRRKVEDSRKIVVGQALCVGGHLYVTNSHNIKGDCEATIVFGSGVDGVRSTIVAQIREDCLYRIEDAGLTFFEIKNLPPMKRLQALLANKIGGVHRGSLLTRDISGSMSQRRLDAVKPMETVVLPGPEKIVHPWTAHATVPTQTGDCGSPVILFTGRGPIISGLHAFGSVSDTHIAGSASLHADMVIEAALALGSPMIECGIPMLSAPSAPRTMGPLHPKSTFRYIEDGSAMVYGSFEGFRPKHKSSVVPTVIAESLEEEGYEVKFGPPVMSSYVPWRHAAMDMVKPVTGIDPTILKKCVEGFKGDILTHLDPMEWEEIQVYDNFTTLNGAEGVAYVDKMNRSTSMGNPYKKSKKYFLEPDVPRGGTLDPVKFCEEIQGRIEEMLATYLRGERVLPNFCAHLKDEAKKFSKIAAGKTRVFTGGPGDWSFLVRKYFLSMVRVMQRNKFIFECGPGTNCASTQWDQIYHFLTKFGEDNIIAGDYAAFDKTMPAEMILAAFEILIWMAEHAGYTPDDLKVMWGIAEDTAFPLVDFNGDLVQFLGSNPSGHPLTVIINGLVNCLYMRYCYLNLNPEKEVISFKKHVALMTYGDDNIAGVSKKTPWYNHTAIQAELQKVGITYTMADKESESVPYINIEDADFLKRTWSYDPDLEVYVAPLSHESIEKSLLRVVKSKTISPEQQAVAVMESAHSEYFFYGRDTFERKAQMFQRVIDKCNLRPYVRETSFPTWDQMVSRFWANSE